MDTIIIKQNSAENYPLIREDIELRVKNDIDIVLELIDVNDNPIDLTGCKIILMVKEKLSDSDVSAKLKKVVTSHTNALNGITTIELTDTDTNLTEGIYFYDITLITSDNLVHMVIQGLFFIFMGINQGTVS